jgi:hypothetical protein
MLFHMAKKHVNWSLPTAVIAALERNANAKYGGKAHWICATAAMIGYLRLPESDQRRLDQAALAIRAMGDSATAADVAAPIVGFAITNGVVIQESGPVEPAAADARRPDAPPVVRPSPRDTRRARQKHR